MSEYLIINIIIIFIPLLLLFEKKINYYKKLPAVFLSIMVVGIIYIYWDIVATTRGDWSFNETYVIGSKFFGLPFEEILFFITVPFSCIFIYETFAYYIKDSTIKINKTLRLIIISLLIAAAYIYSDQYYTITVLLFTAFFFLISTYCCKSILSSKIYWVFILFTFIPFFIVNYILTSLPVVIYSSSAIWGVRITTIPLEDFFYSFSMLSFHLLLYLLFKEKLKIK